jgi:endonuclease/exonuclease/phosphatase family metal-dependent hydrolase
MKDISDRPWLMMGDFNETMWQEEHFSQKARSERLMMDFREVLSHCDSTILVKRCALDL